MALIALDIDGVLLDFHTPFVDYISQHYGFRATLENVTHYYFWKALPISEEQCLESMRRFFTTERFHKLQPLPGAREAVHALAQNHELVVVTSRSADLDTVTAVTLQQHFDGYFKRIYHTTNIAFDHNGGNKGLFCKNLGARLLIEDCAAYARDAHVNGVAALLIDRPWNRCEEVPPAIPRTTWSSVPTLANHLLS